MDIHKLHTRQLHVRERTAFRCHAGGTGLQAHSIRASALVSAGIAAYSTGKAETYGTLVCSFCGKTQEDVKKLIAGNRAYICDECIDLCNEILEETGVKDNLKKE